MRNMLQIEEFASMLVMLRIESLRFTSATSSGNPTSFMSLTEIMNSLCFSEIDIENEFKRR